MAQYCLPLILLEDPIKQVPKNVLSPQISRVGLCLLRMGSRDPISNSFIRNRFLSPVEVVVALGAMAVAQRALAESAAFRAVAGLAGSPGVWAGGGRVCAAH